MATITRIVCPKCKAKLKFDADKITTETVRFKCPGCASVLRFRKPGSPPKDSPLHAAEKSVTEGDFNIDQGASELMELAKKFEEEMGFDRDAAGEIFDDGKKTAKKIAGTEKKPETPEKTVEEAQPGIAAAAESEGKAAPAPAENSEAKAAPASSDSRKYKRVKFKKKVLVNNQIMVEALDISENGLFLHTGRSFEDGAVVDVGIPTMPGNFDLLVKAMVRHNHRGIGMGLQFVDLEEKQHAQLAKLISELDAAAQEELENRKKILLVGGTDTARNINKSKLVLDGFYVLQATTPEEVFKILKDEYPDAMVLEWQEPKFNCKGLLAQIREIADYDAIIRIVLSTLTDSQVQREIIDAGAHRYMAKMDTNPAKLSLVLKKMIEERDG